MLISRSRTVASAALICTLSHLAGSLHPTVSDPVLLDLANFQPALLGTRLLGQLYASAARLNILLSATEWASVRRLVLVSKQNVMPALLAWKTTAYGKVPWVLTARSIRMVKE